MKHRLSVILIACAALSAAVAHAAPVASDRETPSSSISFAESRTRYDGVRYQPRRQRSSQSYGPVPETFGQIHGGAFDPEGNPEAGFLVGVRGGFAPDPHTRFGAMLDWSHKSSRSGTLVTSTPGPGGTTIITERDVASSSLDLVPLMAFIEFVPIPDGPITPYLGLAGGVEWLHLNAEDINIPTEFDADYAGWGWQAWLGAAFEMGPHTRFNAEIFTNGAEVSRDAFDPFLGQDVSETVNMDGSGVRFGISWNR